MRQHGRNIPRPTILLVEDESIVAMDIRQLVESIGYAVKGWVTTGEEAIVRAEELRPDLVLMDIALSGTMTGIEAAAIIRKSYGIPVLYLTANSDRATVENAKDSGPIGYVLKPFEKRELEIALEMALYRSGLEKDLQSALREAELERAKNEAIIAGIGIGLSIQDTSYRVLFQNQIHRDLYGECVGEFCYQSTERCDRRCEECALFRTFSTGAVETSERECDIGHQRRYFEITASPMRNPQGEIFAGIELVKDVTERKLMAIALAESEEQYRKLVEHAPSGIVIVADGLIEFVNPAGVTLFGASGQESLAGAPFLDFIPSGLRELFTEYLFAGTTGKRGDIEGRVIRRDGLEVDVEVTFVPFFSGGRRLVQVIVHNISERMRSEQIIRQMAYCDSLTGLPNRRLFDDRLQLALAQARRYARHLAILYTDLDNFKLINDRFGHTTGDELLKAVAVRLQNCCRRETEVVARFGGDEFVILLPEVEKIAEVQGLTAKIFREFRKKFKVGEHRLATNLSIGISVYPFDGEEPHTLLMRADAALYRAKDQGRNTFRFFTESLQETPMA